LGIKFFIKDIKKSGCEPSAFLFINEKSCLTFLLSHFFHHSDFGDKNE